MSDKRTAKDEQNYIANLKREESIKTEVIVELKRENKRLLDERILLLQNLIVSEDTLRVYRVSALKNTERVLQSESCCISGCDRHYWDRVDGWHRTDEK